MSSINEENKYDDIINLPHYRSKKHPHMSLSSRAAQFAPFAALQGYGDAVEEEARITDKKTELSEEEKADINDKLNQIKNLKSHERAIKITYFIPDRKKAGGSYVTKEGRVAKIDEGEKRIEMEDKTTVSFDDIFAISF